MSGATVRNIAIILGLAAVVAFLPGGDTGAAFVEQILSAIFVVLIALILGQLYRRFQSEIYGLGDRWRLVLYACVGAIVFALAAASRMLSDSGPAGLVVWFALMGGAAYGLYATWRQYREYSI
ncbi:hypothetical protein LRS13_13220 [Svornostia abyssi]|uniref:Uncharacterized protein n=1 Tax=Svornostia abyssi TaxID=2898438 RepID=A0ABY5PAQ1_9ACTN|nr:hypothetical protein LRS13_13220 [Parviterribacteraceae bacterium J379]